VKGEILKEFLVGLRNEARRIESKLYEIDMADLPTMSPEYLMYAQEAADRLIYEIERVERYAK
jgi:hypothetical protein